MTEEQEKIFNDLMKEAKKVLDKAITKYKNGNYSNAENLCEQALYGYSKAYEHAKFYESERQKDAENNLTICKNLLKEIHAMQQFQEVHKISEK